MLKCIYEERFHPNCTPLFPKKHTVMQMLLTLFAPTLRSPSLRFLLTLGGLPNAMVIDIILFVIITALKE